MGHIAARELRNAHNILFEKFEAGYVWDDYIKMEILKVRGKDKWTECTMKLL
jgi:hypothetical protein